MRDFRKAWFKKAIVATAIGLSWVGFTCYEGIVDSVHFYTYNMMSEDNQFPVDFGRLPQRVMKSGWNNERVRGGTTYLTGLSGDGEDWDWNSENNVPSPAEHARNLEVEGQFREAIVAYRSIESSFGHDSFIKDREEVYALARSKPKGWADYLKARFLIELGDPARLSEAKKILKTVEFAPSLRPHVDYALIELDSPGTRVERVKAYESLSERYPNSPRAEPALIMAARSCLDVNSEPPATDVDFKRAETLFQELLTKYPHTRFHDNVLGWSAFIAEHRGDELKAIEFYRRQVRSIVPIEVWKGNNELARIASRDKKRPEAVVYRLKQWILPVPGYWHLLAGLELRKEMAILTAEQANEIQRIVSRDSQLLESYLGFRLEDTKLDPKQQRVLSRFASKSLQRLRSAPTGLVVRVAQLSYNSGSYSSARNFARRVIRQKTSVDDHQRSLYVLAASSARLGNWHEAIRRYESLLSENPPKYLSQAASEHLALIHERHGNVERALGLYLDIGYRDDVAFLADAALSPSQLAHFVRNMPESPAKQVLTYTLAMRYFRLDKFSTAARVFERMAPIDRIHGGMSKKDYVQFRDDVYYDSAPPFADPLVQVQEMAAFRTALHQAGNSDERAEKLYQAAQYVYHHRNLLYYSPGLWKGSRSIDFCIFWSTSVNDKSDEQKALKYGYEHECFAHSLRLCEQIVRDYPHARVVPKALYTAALSAEKLGHLSQWWRDRSKGLEAKAQRYLHQIVVRYPHDPLAKDAAKYARVFKEEATVDYGN